MISLFNTFKFKKNKRYKVLKNSKGLRNDLFYENETLIFIEEAHSFYDSMTIYYFKNTRNEFKQFKLNDDTKKIKLKEFFELI